MATGQSLVERAKQGEAIAIASLMNQSLKSKGTRIQVKNQGSEYKMLVESAQVPNKAATVKWIVSGLRKLSVQTIETLTIYGKAKGSDKPSWTHQIWLNQPTKQQTDPFAEPDPQSSAEPALDLTGYCFTRNKSLLTGKLTLPSEAVRESVVQFDALPNEQKLVILPHVDKLLRKPTKIEDEAISELGKQWIAKIIGLESNDLRKLSIWLSRYCVAQSETVEQLTPQPKPEAAPPAEPAPIEAESSGSVAQAATVQPSTRQTYSSAARPPIAASGLTSSSSSRKVMFAKGSNTPAWVFPAAWGLFLVIAIALGISSVDEMAYAYPICNDSDDLESCVLSVQLAGGEQELETAFLYAYSHPVIAPAMQETAESDCNEAVSFYYGHTGRLDVSPEDVVTLVQTKSEASELQLASVHYQFRNGLEVSTQELVNSDYTQSLVSSQSKSPLPGILLTDVVHRAKNSDETIRAACLSYAHSYSASEVAEYGVSPTQMNGLGISEIPKNWPEEPFMELEENELTAAKSLGIYDVFISLGANTLFTAVGIFIAVLFCSCYRCYTFSGVYKMASVLGIVETIAYSLPGAGFFASIASDVVVMGIASRFVKDFHIDWTGGYKPLATGVLVISLVRLLLCLMMYGAIAQIVS